MSTDPIVPPQIPDADISARLIADEARITQLEQRKHLLTKVWNYAASPFRWVASKAAGILPNRGPITLEKGFLLSWMAFITYAVLFGSSTLALSNMQGCSLPPNPFNPGSPVFPSDGVSRLIVVYDSKSRLDQDVLSALDSEEVRLYAGASLSLVDGTPEARILPSSTDISNDHPVWQEAFKKAKDKKLPYYALIGKSGASDGDLPKSKSDMTAVIKKCCGGAHLPMAARPPPSDYVLTDANTINVRDRKAGLATSRKPMMSAVVSVFDIPEMSDEEINAAIVRKNADHSWLDDIRNHGFNGKPIPSRDQNGKGYCWAHSSVSAMLLLRAKNNQPYSDLSAYAIACIEKQYRDEGGWGIESLTFIAKRGVPSSAFWPQRSMSPSNDKPATWENAKLHKVTEWTQPKTARQFATCLCNNIPVVSDFNWWSHSVCTVRLKSWGTNGNQLKTTIWNSWGDGWSANGMGDLEGSKALPDDMVAPSVGTAAYSKANPEKRSPEILYAQAP